MNTNLTGVSSNQSISDELVLDKNEICIPCPPGFRPNEDSDCDINMMIKVSVGKSEDDNFNYKYTVSGGRIVGEGSKVTWDMTGAQPGTYQISVNIQDKLTGLEQKETETVTVMEQACGGVCTCPILSVVAPTSPTKAGKIMIFTANVSDGSGEEITYNWTTSAGKIIEGQGTPVIKVSTNSKMAGKTVKATVEIGGVCEECPKTESASGSVASVKRVKK